MAWVEISSQRHRRSRIYQQGAEYQTVSTIAPLHYESVQDSGEFDMVIDVTPERVDIAAFDGWRVTANSWHYALGKDLANHGNEDGWIGFGGRQGSHWLKFRLLRLGYLHWPTRSWEDVGGAPTYNRANLSQDTGSRSLGPNADTVTLAAIATWDDLWKTPGGGSVELRWRVNGDQLKEDVVLNQTAREWISANAPPSTPLAETYFGFVFRLDWSDVPRVYRAEILQDVDGDFADDGVGIELADALDRVLGFLPLSHVYAGLGKNAEAVEIRRRFWLDGDGNHYLLLGIRCDLLAGLPSGDLYFDPTVTPQIGSQNDDCEQYSSNFYTSGIELYIGNDGTANNTGYRFALNVPASATITAAKLTLTAYLDGSGSTVQTKISYHDTNDPSDFSGDDAASFLARTRSAADYDWDFTAGWTEDQEYDTDDFTSVIQALVNEAYWAANEHVVLFIDDDGSTAYRQAYAYDLGSSHAAVLTVTYSTAGISIPVVMHHLRQQEIA